MAITVEQIEKLHDIYEKHTWYSNDIKICTTCGKIKKLNFTLDKIYLNKVPNNVYINALINTNNLPIMASFILGILASHTPEKFIKIVNILSKNNIYTLPGYVIKLCNIAKKESSINKQISISFIVERSNIIKTFWLTPIGEEYFKIKIKGKDIPAFIGEKNIIKLKNYSLPNIRINLITGPIAILKYFSRPKSITFFSPRVVNKKEYLKYKFARIAKISNKEEK